MMEGISIRRADIQDIGFLVELEDTCFDKTKYFSYMYKENDFLNCINGIESFAFVAISANNKVVGYVDVCAGEATAMMEISSLAVDPLFQGRGIGTLLLSEAENYAKSKGAKGISLEVREDNVSAITLYKKLGFGEEERLSGFYDDGQDAIRLFKYFNP